MKLLILTSFTLSVGRGDTPALQPLCTGQGKEVSSCPTWVLSARGWSLQRKESLGRGSTVLAGTSPVNSPFCLLSLGRRHTFSLLLSSLGRKVSGVGAALAVIAADRARTGLPLWTVSQPSASFCSVHLREENTAFL